MASNTKSFTITIDSDRETLTYVDAVTYVDPVRADGAVHFSVAKVAYDGTEEDLTVTSDDSDPATDSEWSIDYSNGDGYYKARYAFIPTYDAGTTYAQYDCVDDAGSVYRSKSAGNVGNAVANTTFWEPISDGASIADNKDEDNESSNCDTTIYERTFTANGQYGYGNCVSLNSMHTESDDEDILTDYDLFSILLNGAVTADERTETLSGELICRRIESKFGSKYMGL